MHEHAIFSLAANLALRVDELQETPGCGGERFHPPKRGRRAMTHDELRLQELHGSEAYWEINRASRLDPGPRADRGPALSPERPRERTGGPAAFERTGSEEHAFLGESEQGFPTFHAPSIPNTPPLGRSLWITVEGVIGRFGTAEGACGCPKPSNHFLRFERKADQAVGPIRSTGPLWDLESRTGIAPGRLGAASTQFPPSPLYLVASGVPSKLDQERVTALVAELKKESCTARSIAAVLKTWAA